MLVLGFTHHSGGIKELSIQYNEMYVQLYLLIYTKESVKGDRCRGEMKLQTNLYIESGGILYVTRHLNHTKALMRCISNNWFIIKASTLNVLNDTLARLLGCK